jgi:nitroreductase
VPVTEPSTAVPDDDGELDARAPLPADTVGLLEGLTTTRAIRRYKDEPVPESVLRAILFAATRAPTGTNRQHFRFIVLTDSPNALAAKKLIAQRARSAWAGMRARDGYDSGSGAEGNSRKTRMARTMQEFTDNFEKAPILILPCLIRQKNPSKLEAASIYPAVQNILLAARALGYGGVLTGYHLAVEDELVKLLDIPPNIFIAGTITLGKPQGSHGTVRRRPLSELVFVDKWGNAPSWAIDPPGTEYASAGPPKRASAEK